jgi:hypothetical protein
LAETGDPAVDAAPAPPASATQAIANAAKTAISLIGFMFVPPGDVTPG